MVTVYALAAMAQFGAQCLQWDPLVLRDAFQEDFDCKLSQKAFDKLQAGMSMIGTNLFTHSIETFLACTALCNEKPVKQDQLNYVTLKDCCWAVFCWQELLGYDPQEDNQTFDDDIIMYIQALMDKDGISQLPQFMSFAKLPDDKLTTIQQNLAADASAFQSYHRRQQQNVNDIKAFIKDKQTQLAMQLRQFKDIMESKQKGFKIPKK